MDSSEAIYLGIFVKSLFTDQMQRVFGRKSGMLGIKVSELEVDNFSCVAHVTSFRIDLSGQERVNYGKQKDQGENSGGKCQKGA